MQTEEGYRHSYEKWGGTSKYKKERAKRNNARRRLVREGRVHKGDNKDVDHIKGIGGGNSNSNLRVVDRSTNRARRQGPRKRGSKRKK